MRGGAHTIKRMSEGSSARYLARPHHQNPTVSLPWAEPSSSSPGPTLTIMITLPRWLLGCTGFVDHRGRHVCQQKADRNGIIAAIGCNKPRVDGIQSGGDDRQNRTQCIVKRFNVACDNVLLKICAMTKLTSYNMLMFAFCFEVGQQVIALLSTHLFSYASQACKPSR